MCGQGKGAPVRWPIQTVGARSRNRLFRTNDRCARIRDEVSVRACLEHHICALPGFIVDQAPLVTRTDVVLCQQHLTGMNGEGLAVHRRELQHTGEGDNVLRDWSVMPLQRRVRRSLLEMDEFRFDDFVATDAAVHYVRVSILAGVETVSSNHFCSLRFSSITLPFWRLSKLYR